MLTVLAPAKINLTLEVLGRRPDGYHEIRSIIQTVNLVDIINFEESGEIFLQSDFEMWDGGKTLVRKAVELVRETANHNGGVSILINKNIPLMAGLGGDLSDAAATLKGLNQLWGLELNDDQLRELAAQLGSDVSFFITGGTALVTGRGETVSQLMAIPKTWFVILVPPGPREPGKTARMYHSLTDSDFSKGELTLNYVSGIPMAVMSGQPVLPHMINVFDNIAFEVYPELEDYLEELAQAGAKEIHLAGSGPALFTMLPSQTEAEKIHGILKNQGRECYLVESMNPLTEK